MQDHRTAAAVADADTGGGPGAGHGTIRVTPAGSGALAQLDPFDHVATAPEPFSPVATQVTCRSRAGQPSSTVDVEG